MSFSDPLRDGTLWFWGTAVLILLLAVPLTVLIRLLRKDNPELYEELGSPRWFWGSDPGARFKFTRFLFSSGPKEARDRRVRAWCRIIRPLYVVALVWVLFPFVVILWFAVTGQG